MKVRLGTVALGLIIASGAFLRLTGLNHDLFTGYAGANHNLVTGYNYHPDAAKHLRAAQWFLGGHYFLRMRNRDWDGYPLFNSHLLEFVLRSYRTVTQTICFFLGIQEPVGYPDYDQGWFFWIARLMNTTIGTLAIGVAYRIGNRCFGTVAGLLAALFLAWSPIDIVSSHYEAGDTTAAFFALVSTLFALRVVSGAKIRDYTFAVFFATCGFAAKYDAGMAIVPLGTAHVLYWRNETGLFSRGSMERMLATLAAGVVSLLIVIPPLRWAPIDQISDILGFFHFLWTSTETRIPALAGTGFLERVTYSIRHQAPILLRIVSPWLAATLILGGARLRGKEAAVAVLASLPLVFLLLGVSFRPVVQPVYYTLVTPSLFVLVAGILVVGSQPGNWTSRAALGLRLLVGLLCVASLLRSSLREDFYFLHMDTQRVGLEWVRENVPGSFKRVIGDYSIVDEGSGQLGPETVSLTDGTLFASGSERPIPVPPVAVFLKRLSLERDRPLPVFRNPTAEIYAVSPWLRKERFRVPPFPRRPASFASDFVFLGGREFYRSESIVAVSKDEPVNRIVVSESPLENVLLFMQNGERRATLSISFGGVQRLIVLAPSESTTIAMPSPRASFPSHEGHDFYWLRVSSDDGTTWVTVAANAFDKGWGFYEQADYAQAYPWLVAAARASNDPMVAALAVISGTRAGLRHATDDGDWIADLAAALQTPANEERLDDIYGGALRYLSALDYFSVEAEDASLAGFEVVSDKEASGGKAVRMVKAVPAAVEIELPMFAPGLYAARLRIRCEASPGAGGSIQLRLLGPSGEEDSTRKVPLPSAGDHRYVELQVPLRISQFRPRWKLGLSASPGAEIVIDRIAVVPDLPSEWSDLGRVLSQVTGQAQHNQGDGAM